MKWSPAFTAWNNLIGHSHEGGLTTGSVLNKQAALVAYFVNMIESDGASGFFEGAHAIGSAELQVALEAVGASKLAQSLGSFTAERGGPIPPHPTDDERDAFLDTYWQAGTGTTNLNNREAVDDTWNALRRHVDSDLDFWVSLSSPEELAYDKFEILSQTPFENIPLPSFKKAAIARRILGCFEYWGMRTLFNELPCIMPDEVIDAAMSVGAPRTAKALNERWASVTPPILEQIRNREPSAERRIRKDDLDVEGPERFACMKELERALRAHAADNAPFYLAT